MLYPNNLTARVQAARKAALIELGLLAARYRPHTPGRPCDVLRLP